MKLSSTVIQPLSGVVMWEPVTITKNGRDHMVLVSADSFEAATKGRVARRIEALDEATISAIAAAEVPVEYVHLDCELDCR